MCGRRGGIIVIGGESLCNIIICVKAWYTPIDAIAILDLVLFCKSIISVVLKIRASLL